MSNKIIFIVRKFNPNTGSYAGVVEYLSKHLSKKGFKIMILCAQTNENEKFRENLGYVRIKRFRIPKYKIPLIGMNKDYIFLGLKVKNYFKKTPPKKSDILVANGRAALGALKYKYVLRMGQPAFTFLKNMEIAKNEASPLTRMARLIHFSFQYFLERKCVINAEAFITSSNDSIKEVFKYYGNKNKPYFIPHGGVKFKELQSRQKLDIEGKKILFVSAGSEKIRKGVVYLEKALPLIFKKYKNAKLIHVGKKFKWNVPNWCMNRIISVGKVSWNQMPKYYRTADLLVNCALNEWIPHIIFEAMAVGTPIVTSDIEGIHETLIHLEESYIYRRGDVNGLVKGISYMLENPKESTKMAKRAKSKIKSISYGRYSESLQYFLENIFSNKKEKLKYFNVLNSVPILT